MLRMVDANCTRRKTFMGTFVTSFTNHLVHIMEVADVCCYIPEDLNDEMTNEEGEGCTIFFFKNLGDTSKF